MASTEIGTLTDEEILERLYLEDIPEKPDELNGHCPSCNVPMLISGIEYQCKECGLTRLSEAADDFDKDENISGNIKKSVGAHKGGFYIHNNDYSKTQKQAIITQLDKLQRNYKGLSFHPIVISNVVYHYNNIQKNVTLIKYDKFGKANGPKKFVHRGDIKNEILAALIYFECIKIGVERRKKEIAEFMNLSIDGFSRGEGILRDLEAEGKIQIPVNQDSVKGFAERYLNALDLENDRYCNFVIELVDTSYEKKIGMNSQMSSKVVGAIWILIKCLGLTLDVPPNDKTGRPHMNDIVKKLETSTDNTRKNTFTKFSGLIFKNGNYTHFKHIFEKYNIPANNYTN